MRRATAMSRTNPGTAVATFTFHQTAPFHPPSCLLSVTSWKCSDHTLRYSTGALEKALCTLIETKLGGRRHWLKNRYRTDCLLMLLHLSALGRASQGDFLKILDHWLRHNGQTPRQRRAVDSSYATASLRSEISDVELIAAGLPDHAGYEIYRQQRRIRLRDERRRRRRQTDPNFRARDNADRLKRRHRSDPGNLTQKRWRAKHAVSQRASARERKTAA